MSDAVPAFSISQITTLTSSFADDLVTYRTAGLDGIGVWEQKLPDDGDAQALEQFEASGLRSAAAVPAIPSILPLPLMAGPSDPEVRVQAICSSLERLAAFRPSGVVCLTGPAGERDGDEARAVVVDGLRTIGAEAGRIGVRVGLEPVNRVGGENWTIVNSVSESVELLAEVASPSLGIQFDAWHLWSTETLLEDIARDADRFVGVHIADWRDPTRSWADRVLPGDGVADVPAILDALDRAGWDGLYDLEIFSDNGAFGQAWPDSLWDVEPAEIARRGKRALERAWEARIREPIDRVSPGVL